MRLGIERELGIAVGAMLHAAQCQDIGITFYRSRRHPSVMITGLEKLPISDTKTCGALAAVVRITQQGPLAIDSESLFVIERCALQHYRFDKSSCVWRLAKYKAGVDDHASIMIYRQDTCSQPRRWLPAIPASQAIPR